MLTKYFKKLTARPNFTQIYQNGEHVTKIQLYINVEY